MSYVSISRDLTHEVGAFIRNLAQLELNSMSSFDRIREDAMKDDAFQHMLDAALWGDLLDLKPRLEKFSFPARVDLQLACSRPVDDGTFDTFTTELQIERFPVPITCKTSGYGYLDLKIDTGLHPLLIEARDLAVLRRECSKRWEKVQAQVLKFLGSCKSLNEAIKLWPDVRRYIPKDYLKRVDTKVEKTKTKSSGADALAGMDMDMVNTSLVLARMAGASL